jgi:tetratricopeptide (TPR) repeat protein
MRRLPLPLLLALLATPAVAEIRSADDCAAAVARDPAAAREEAAVWSRLGGGVAARLCEAEALAAMGAHATAAQILVGVGTNPNRAMATSLRAVVLADGAGQWLVAGRPDLARAALVEADRLVPPDPERRLLAARAAAAEADWPAVRSNVEALVAERPDDALPHALLAAALRNLGEPAQALAEAERARRLNPELPEALFEAGAALAETGAPDRAAEVWLELIATAPDSPLAALARKNLQRLN